MAIYVTGDTHGSQSHGINYVSPRYTPYHLPHRTEIAGFMTILHGDMRFYNNIFVQQEVPEFLRKAAEHMKGGAWDDGNVTVGISPYDDYQTEEEWKAEFEGYCGMGSAPSDRYYIPLPVWANGNIYFNGAKPWKKEHDPAMVNEKVEISARETKDGWQICTNIPELLPKKKGSVINTEILGMAFEPEQKYENPDGTPIAFDGDYMGCFKSWKIMS